VDDAGREIVPLPCFSERHDWKANGDRTLSSKIFHEMFAFSNVVNLFFAVGLITASRCVLSAYELWSILFDHGISVNGDQLICYSFQSSVGLYNDKYEDSVLPCGQAILRNSMSHGYRFHFKPLACGVVIVTDDYIVASRPGNGAMWDPVCWGDVKHGEDPFTAARREFNEEVSMTSMPFHKLQKIGPIKLKYATFYGYYGEDKPYRFEPGEGRVIEKGSGFRFRTDPGVLISHIVHALYEGRSSRWSKMKISIHGARHCFRIRVPVHVRNARLVRNDDKG